MKSKNQKSFKSKKPYVEKQGGPIEAWPSSYLSVLFDVTPQQLVSLKGKACDETSYFAYSINIITTKKASKRNTYSVYFDVVRSFQLHSESFKIF